MIIYIICENVDFHLLSISGINYVHKQEVFGSKKKLNPFTKGKGLSILFVIFLQNIEVIAILQCASYSNIAMAVNVNLSPKV